MRRPTDSAALSSVGAEGPAQVPFLHPPEGHCGPVHSSPQHLATSKDAAQAMTPTDTTPSNVLVGDSQAAL